eukprot:jgi/Botrbrau1/21747/Bobra.43_1s0141.1
MPRGRDQNDFNVPEDEGASKVLRTNGQAFLRQSETNGAIASASTSGGQASSEDPSPSSNGQGLNGRRALLPSSEGVSLHPGGGAARSAGTLAPTDKSLPQDNRDPAGASGSTKAEGDARRLSESLPMSKMRRAELAQNRNKGIMKHGCTHYRRRCKMVAPCCNEVFWCRHCHNAVKNAHEYDPDRRHELERTRVRELVCALCEERQPVASECRKCGVCFGEYTCLKCTFFDDDLRRGQFHCDDCGICRVGGQEKFFHCRTCGCCYSKSLENNHVCVANSMHQNCPVCFEYLFDSVRATSVLPCGHTIHADCLKEMEKNNQTTCPTCRKSYKDMHQEWDRMDAEVAATPMPVDFSTWRVNIRCNDCFMASTIAYHVVGLKCPHCFSYNTSREALLRDSPVPVRGEVR